MHGWLPSPVHSSPHHPACACLLPALPPQMPTSTSTDSAMCRSRCRESAHPAARGRPSFSTDALRCCWRRGGRAPRPVCTITILAPHTHTHAPHTHHRPTPARMGWPPTPHPSAAAVPHRAPGAALPTLATIVFIGGSHPKPARVAWAPPLGQPQAGFLRPRSGRRVAGRSFFWRAPAPPACGRLTLAVAAPAPISWYPSAHLHHAAIAVSKLLLGSEIACLN